MQQILIVEDEKTIADRLARLCGQILPDSSHRYFRSQSIQEAEEIIASESIDLLFLDLNLNGDDGFEIMKKFSSQEFHTIVVSAHADRAIEAFEHGVLDFIPKPFSKDRLSRGITRWQKNLRDKPGVSRKHLVVSVYGSLELIRIEEVSFIKGAGVYSELHLKDGSKKIHNKSLDKLMALLPLTFERVHRSYIVNAEDIDRILVHPGGKYELQLNDQQRVPLSRNKYREIKESLI